MKKLFQRLFLLGVVAVLANLGLLAQVQIGPINYTTLKAAFDAINSGVHTGNITVLVTGNTVETATAVLNRSGSGAASYTAVNIYTDGNDTISGSVTPLVRFADADNITIDGRVGQTGSTNSLTFQSTNTGGTVIWIDSTAGGNGAKNILIRNINILGASATTTSYGINVSSSSSQTTGAPGFDNIQILYCNFARIFYGINIRGGSVAAQYATNIVVRFNNFGQNATANMFNYYGIYIGYAQAPIVRNNYFSYNTTTLLYSIFLSYVNNGNVSDNTLENVIGSSSIYLIYSSYGTGLIANNNVARNITSSGGAFYGVYDSYTPSATISNNIFENINVTSTIYGIYIYLSSTTPYGSAIVQSNTLRNAFTTAGTVYGIYTYYLNNATINNNRIENVTGYYTLAGMYFGALTNSNIKNNIIRNLTQTYASAGYYQAGMVFLSNCNGDTIVNNEIARITGMSTQVNNVMYSPNGIQIQGGTNYAIWHNSIYLNGTHPNATNLSTAAFALTTTTVTGLNIQNNVFANSYASSNASSKSYAIYIAGTANLTNSTINYNDYYVSGANGVLGYLGADANDLVSWQGLSAQDLNSISANPIFNNLTNLRPYTGSPLLAAGTPIALVTDDITGVTRSTTAPTIGAYEEAGDFDVPEVTFVALPNIGAGVPSHTLVATITDLSGIDTVNMPRLYYRKSSNANTYVDNTNQTDGWKYAVATALGGDQYQFVIDHNLIFGGLALGDTVQYFIVAADNFTNPNIGVYGATLANQITNVALTSANFPATGLQYFYRVLPSFSGIVEVGAGQTYTTLTGAGGLFTALNNAVLTGNLTIRIVSDIAEPGTFALGEIPSSGGTFTITIRPWGAPRTLSFNKTGACLMFVSTDRLTIDGRLTGFTGNALTITNAVQTAVHQVIHIAGTNTNGATNITIRNVNIVGGHPAINNTTNTYGILVATSAIGQVPTNHNITLLENNISRVYYGIRIMGASPGLNGITIGKNFIGNDVDSMTVVFKGIALENTNAAQITYNTLRNIKANASINIAAIELTTGNFYNTYIYGNKIQGVANPASGGWGAYGINFAVSTIYNTYIINNMISDVTTMNYSTSSTIYNPFGIRVAGGIGYYVYHNTIDMSGTMANVGTVASMSACVLVTSTAVDSVFVRNNIFVNRTIHNIAGSRSFIYYLPTTTWAGIRYCDYNHYFIGGNYPFFAFYLNQLINTFAAWKAAVTPIDSNSTHSNVSFVGVRNAYLGLGSLGNPDLIKPTFTGMPDEDIDGEFRDPVVNYAGADIAVPTGLVIAEDLPFTLLKGGDPFSLTFLPQITGFADEVNRGTGIGDAAGFTYEWFYNNAPLTSTPGVREVNRNSVDFINPAANLSGDYYATVSFGTLSATTNTCALSIDPLLPTLVAPANDSDDRPLNVTLQWTSVPAATSYQVQISTSPLFTTTVFDTIVTSNSVIPSNLTYLTTYFWRVAGRQGTTAGQWTQPWVFTTRPAIYPCVLLSPAEGQTFVEVNPELTWQLNVDATFYRVQIASDIAFQNIVMDTTTINNFYTSHVTLQYLTTYYWRVQGLNPPYESEWSIVRSFFTRPAIYTPTLVFPANNATKISTNPILRWNVANGATSYNLVVWKDSVGTTPVVNTVVNDTLYQLQNLYGETPYYWQVQGLNPTHQSEWSAIWKFTTKKIFWGPVYQDTITVGTGTSTASYPFFTYYMDSRMQTIILASEIGNLSGAIIAIAYNVATNATQPMYGFTVKMKNTTATAVGTEFDNVGLTTVYYNNGEVVSSTGWKYLTLQTPFAYDPTKNLLIDICFDNTAWTSNSTVYSHTTTANLTLHRFADLTTGNGCVDLSSANAGGVYTNRPNTRIVGYADGWLSPKQYLPQNNAVNVLLNPTSFVWGWLEDASSYQIQVATDSSFTNIIIDQTTVDTTLDVTTLSYITTYYWRVRGINIHQNSVWSATRKFTTRPAIFPITLVAPLNGAQYIPMTQTFIWRPESNATQYQLQVSTTPTFVSTLLDYTTTDTSYTFTTIPNATIYWRVRGLNATNTGEWSAVWSFTTIPNIYPPIPVEPFSGATDYNPSPLFVWTSISNATGYSFELAADPLFNTLIDSYTGVDTTYRVWGLEGGTTYYWRVRAFNSTDVSDWSGTSSFTTINQVAELQLGTIGTTSSWTYPFNRWYNYSTAEVIYNQSNFGTGTKTIKSIAFYKMSGTLLGDILDVRIYMRHTTDSVQTIGQVLNATTLLPIATDYQLVYTGSFPNDSTTGWMKVDLDSLFIYNGNDHLEVLFVKGYQQYQSGYPFWATSPTTLVSSAYSYSDNVQPTATTTSEAYIPVTRFEFVASSLDAPVLLSPPNNDINRPTTNNLVWDPNPVATRYRVQLSDNANFTNLLVNQVVTTTNYVVSGLDSGTTYHWRVKAINDTATSAWSAVWKFTTAYPPLTQPVLVSPPNNAVNIIYTPNIPLQWQAVPYAVNFKVQISLDSFQTVLAQGTFAASITQVFFTGATPNTTYYWRVIATNPSDTAISDIWNFTTIPLVTPPTLVSPPDSTMNVPVMATLTWTAVNPSIGYHVQVTAIPNVFANLIVNDTVTTNSITVQLQPNTEYWWRVRTIRTDTVSAWSNVWYFKTIGPVTQTFPLVNGWNMISANVEPLTNNISSLMQPLSGNLQILRNYTGQAYVPPFTNTLSTWNKYHAYQLRMTTSQQYEIQGMQITPETTPITLNVLGWYWLPYYRTSAMPVGTALATISGKYLQVKTITGQVYMPPFATTLSDLEPGKGYMIRLIQDNGVLTYPANGIIKGASNNKTFAEPKVFVRPNVSTGKNAFIALDIDAQDGDEIGVFTRDGMLVGSSVWQDGLRGVVVWGDDEYTVEKDGAAEGEELIVRVWSRSNETIGEVKGIEAKDMANGGRSYGLRYETDAVVMLKGTVEAEGFGVMVTPQPASNELYITLGKLSSEGVAVELYNQSGRLMLSESGKATNGVLKLDVSSLPSGVYNAVIRTAGTVMNERVVIVR